MDILHELIKSMSPSEKGYFKKHASQGRDLDYLRLFDAIAAMEDYDEEKLLRKFKKAFFVKHLSKSKNYLYNSIIKVLLVYHEESSPKIIIRNLLSEAEMLHNRGLLGQVRKRIEKAKAMSLETESFTTLLEALQHQRKLCDTGTYQIEDLTGEEVGRQIAIATEQQSNYNIYQELSNRQHRIVKPSAHLRQEEVKKQLHEILKHPYLQDISKAKSVKAKLLFYYIKFYTNVMLLDYKNARHFASCNLELAKQNTAFNAANPQILLDAYNMVLTSHHYLDNPSFVARHLSELRNVEVKTPWLDIVKFQYYYSFALSYFVESDQRDEFMIAAREATNRLYRGNYFIKDEFRLALSVAISEGYIHFGVYDKAIAVIEKYRQNPPKQIRNDYQSYLLIFYLIAQYEIGNHILVRNLLSNVERFMKRTGEFSEIERLILKVFDCVIANPPGKKLTNELAQLKIRISQVAEENGGMRWYNYVSIIGPFIDSKVKGVKINAYKKAAGVLSE